MTRTTPLRRTTLHFGQIRFTDERTFMFRLPFPFPSQGARRAPLHKTYLLPTGPAHWAVLFQAVHDPPAVEVVGRELHQHAIARQDADEMLAHLAGDVRQDLVLVVELHPEHRVRERLDDRGLDLDRLFF